MVEKKFTDLPAVGLGNLTSADIMKVVNGAVSKRVTLGEVFRQLPVGAVTAPSLKFGTGQESGFYYDPATNELHIVINGVSVGSFDATGISLSDFTNAGHTHADTANGGLVDHADLTTIGSNSHAQIDTGLTNSANHISDTTKHFLLIDEDDMGGATSSDTKAPTQQSVNEFANLLRKNLLINANPLVNQRGYVSGTATTGANEYTLDRWRVVTSTEDLKFSTALNVVTMTLPAGGIEQEIEGLNIQSGTHVISFVATGDTVVAVDGVTKASGDTFTLVGGTNAIVKASSVLGTGTIKLIQVEFGSVATPFGHLLYTEVFGLCWAFYRRYQTGSANEEFPFPVWALNTNTVYAFVDTTGMRDPNSASANSTGYADFAVMHGGAVSPTSESFTIFDTCVRWRFNSSAAFTGGYASAIRDVTGSKYVEVHNEL